MADEFLEQFVSLFLTLWRERERERETPKKKRKKKEYKSKKEEGQSAPFITIIAVNLENNFSFHITLYQDT
jgi:hypothetical protein